MNIFQKLFGNRHKHEWHLKEMTGAPWHIPHPDGGDMDHILKVSYIYDCLSCPRVEAYTASKNGFASKAAAMKYYRIIRESNNLPPEN